MAPRAAAQPHSLGYVKRMRILAGINVAVWGALVWVGWSLLAGITAQHVAGFPGRGQTLYYLWVPSAVTVTALAAFVVAKYRQLRLAAMVVEVALLLAVFPFLLAYGGGV